MSAFSHDFASHAIWQDCSHIMVQSKMGSMPWDGSAGGRLAQRVGVDTYGARRALDQLRAGAAHAACYIRNFNCKGAQAGPGEISARTQQDKGDNSRPTGGFQFKKENEKHCEHEAMLRKEPGARAHCKRTDVNEQSWWVRPLSRPCMSG